MHQEFQKLSVQDPLGYRIGKVYTISADITDGDSFHSGIFIYDENAVLSLLLPVIFSASKNWRTV